MSTDKIQYIISSGARSEARVKSSAKFYFPHSWFHTRLSPAAAAERRRAEEAGGREPQTRERRRQKRSAQRSFNRLLAWSRLDDELVGCACLGPQGGRVWAGWPGRTWPHDALALNLFARALTESCRAHVHIII